MVAGTYPQIMPAVPHKRHHLAWVIIVATVLIGAGILAGVAYALRPQPVSCTPPSCHLPPPKANPLPAAGRYTSSDFGFSLDYPTNEAPTKETSSAVEWISDDQSEGMVIKGEDPNGESPQQLVEDTQQAHFADATPAYPPSGIPHADLGYTPGYGQVYDLFASGGQEEHDRIVIMAAVKNGTAILMVAAGPFQRTNENNDGHPNPAELDLVHTAFYHMATSSLTWQGEPPF